MVIFVSILVPNRLAYFGADMTLSKHAIQVSNMAASREHVWSFDGKKTHWVAIATSCPNTIVSLVSLHDKVKVSIASKTAQFKDSKMFVEMIEENMILD